MFKLAALGLAVLMTAAPAVATEELTREEKEHLQLLGLVEALGVAVEYNLPVCKNDWYGAYKTNGEHLVLCGGKAESRAEALSVIRHEAWHVLQDLKGDCSLKDTTALRPVFSADMVDATYRTWASKAYKPEHVAVESEAEWAADIFNAKQINILLYTNAKSCRFKF